MSGTSVQDIRGMLARAPEGTTHVIIACDDFDNEDYPVYTSGSEDYADQMKRLGSASFSGFAKYHEVYDLGLDIESQLSENRAYHPPTK